MQPQAPKLIGLVRVSTNMQDESGLGQKAQRAAIEAYRAQIGGELIRTYEEVGSGTYDDLGRRPMFLKAVAHARRSNAVLVIGKLDRLARSSSVVNHLKKARVRFVACDNPFATELTIDILVAVAADEARRIQTRVREALAAYKADHCLPKRLRKLYPEGVPAELAEPIAGKLGASLPQCRNLSDADRYKGAQAAAKARALQAEEAYQDIAPWMAELRSDGKSLAEIAEALNQEGHTTRTGKPWNKVQVARVLERQHDPAGAA
jgi:DNA invertase Pin-like site-specific DNA recombinase